MAFVWPSLEQRSFAKKYTFFSSICTFFMFLSHDPLQQGTKIHLHKAQFCLYSLLRCLLAFAVGGGYSDCQVHITFLYIQYLTVSYHLEQRAHYRDYSSCKNVCPINANILNTIQSLPEILNHIPFEQNILTYLFLETFHSGMSGFVSSQLDKYIVPG